MMTPSIRKFALTTHVTSSVGWLGAVASFLALAVAGLNSADPHLVRSAYVAMEFVTWFVIVPLSVAALVTGVVQSLGTTWGLFRHYWVVAKLAVTVIATAILFVHTQPIEAVASAAIAGPLEHGELRGVRVQLLADAVAALGALLMATALSIYKPMGVTPYGAGQLALEQKTGPRWARFAFWFVVAGIAMFLLVHLAGGGMHGH